MNQLIRAALIPFSCANCKKAVLKGLSLLFPILFTQNVFAQAPNIIYGNNNNVKVTGTIPFTTTPANSGGAVPPTIYGQVSTVAGSPTGLPGFVNGLGTAALFNNSQDMAKDAAGNLYVADASNNAIRMITPDGLVSTFAGNPNGLPGFGDGQDTTAFFNYPDGLTFDSSGNLFVADYYNQAIRKISPSGMVTTVYQNLTEEFDPQSLMFDSTGNLIFALQYGYQIVKLSPSNVLTTIAGTNGLPGADDGIGAAARFDGPTDSRFDPAGNLIIADALNNELRKITPDGTVTTIAGKYNDAILYKNGLDTAARFNYPTGVEIVQGGIIYIVDLLNNDIRRMMPDGTITLLAGSPTQTPGNADGIRTAAQFDEPCYLRMDKTGVGYIAEWGLGGASRIRKIILTGYTLDGTLPPGLAFDPTTGIISGTVTAPFTAQTDTITAYNATGYSTAIVTLTYQPASTVATLINLAPSAGVLDPSFVSSTTHYVDSVSNATKTITLTPTVTDSTATITVNGKPVASGTPSDAIPLAVGSNTITVVVTAQDGVTTDTYTVVVYRGEAPDDINCNNVLTPNGDGKNDYWVITDIGLYPQNNVIVFDKGGRVVYSKRSYNNEWDGTLNGRPLAEGTYYFVVDLGPNLRKFKGSISILRN